jgi:hypothetical protein
MASFTDAITQFNPYVAQLPVEAMLKVGMYKQGKYEEGVQKIQGEIDKVAGLDINKPVARQYLQSKLNQLGGKLKTVAAGDFSNFQLVNSVGGMASQIGKDPTIQNAVLSTQYVRKGQQDIEAARKSGKYSIKNEGWFNHGVNGWMNDNDLNSSFNQRYVEYRDMEEKLRGVADKVHEYDQSIENPYQKTNSGQTLYFYRDPKGNEIATIDPTKGQPKIDEVVLKTKVKGKSAQKILDNFYSSLDADDIQQLKIDGWYHYKGYTGDAFKNKIKEDITSTFKMKEEILSKEIVKISAELSGNSKLTTEQKEGLELKLNQYTDIINKGGIAKQLNEKLKLIGRMDDTELKGSVYMENSLTDLAKNISYQSIETEYKDNPYFNALMKKEDLKFKYFESARDQKNKDRTYGLDLERLNIEKFKLTKEGAGKDVIFENIGVPTDAKLPTLTDLQNSITGLDETMQVFKQENAPFLLSGYDKMDNNQRREAMNELVNKYQTNPSSITDNNKRRILDQWIGMSTDMTRRMGNYVNIATKAKPFDDAIDKIAETLPGYTKNGKQVYSAKEITNVLSDNRFDTPYEYNEFGVPIKGGQIDWEAYKKAYANSPYLPIILAREKRQKTGLASLQGDEIKLMQTIDNVKSEIRSKGNNILQEKNKFVNTELGKIMPQYQDEVGTLNKKDDITMGKVDNLIGNMYSIASQLGGKIDSEKFDPGVITGWRTGKQASDLTYIVKRKADMSGGTLQIFNGNEVQEIPLNSKQLGDYFPQAARGHPLDGAKYMIMGSATKTTNAMGSVDGSPNGAINAAFTGNQLPLLQGSPYANLVRFDIEGATDNNGDDDDQYQLRMYVNDNGTWKSDIVNTQGFARLDGVLDIMQNIGTKKYEEIKAKK